MRNLDSKDCSFTISNFVSRYQNREDSVLIFSFIEIVYCTIYSTIRIIFYTLHALEA